MEIGTECGEFGANDGPSELEGLIEPDIPNQALGKTLRPGAVFLAKLGRLLVLPHRPGRIEPRVRKRRPKQFPVMQKPRQQLKQVLMKPWKEGLSYCHSRMPPLFAPEV